MTVKAGDIPVILTERIEVSHPAPALFSTAEADEWPAGILQHLLGCSILQPAHRAGSVLCPGCEWQCHKAVAVRTVCTGPRRQAFVTCDEEPGNGRISVPLRSLIQYHATLAGVSAFIAGLMKLGPPQSSASGVSFLLGSIKGRHGLRQVLVSLDGGRLVLRIGHQFENVVHVLRWAGAGLSINMAHIQLLASRKQPVQRSRTVYLPDRTMRQERSRETRVRNEAILRQAKKLRAEPGGSWSAIANAIAATDVSKAGHRRQLSAATVRRIIAAMLNGERESSRSDRKKRR